MFGIGRERNDSIELQGLRGRDQRVCKAAIEGIQQVRQLNGSRPGYQSPRRLVTSS